MSVGNYANYPVCSMYNIQAKLRLALLLRQLEDSTNVRWPNGHKPTKWDIPDECYYLRYMAKGQFLYYLNAPDLSVFSSENKGLVFDVFEDFIKHINDDMNGVSSVSIKSDPSDWNCLCSCGAEAYFTGFSLECSRNCGSKVPDMSTVK